MVNVWVHLKAPQGGVGQFGLQWHFRVHAVAACSSSKDWTCFCSAVCFSKESLWQIERLIDVIICFSEKSVFLFSMSFLWIQIFCRVIEKRYTM